MTSPLNNTTKTKFKRIAFVQKLYLHPIMRKQVHIYVFFVGIILAFSSCSEYTRLLKSNDIEKKEAKAEEYYEAGKYDRVLSLTEDLIPTFRGTNKNERLFYLYAISLYKNRDYLYAQHYLESFARTFPKSKYSEECSFLSAHCSYLRSPRFYLDQSETTTALNDFQLFLESYPKTELRDSCNNIITELEEKLLDKSFNNAKLYFNIGNYKSSVIALNHVIKEFPSCKYEEEMRFMVLKSSYLLAMNSVDEKKIERLEDTLKAYQNYIDKFADSKKANQAENLFKDAFKELEENRKLYEF
jgi:outer membrane protein assembly factor BamD